jgi:single-stranded-DNA-specific exonuclease RecJ
MNLSKKLWIWPTQDQGQVSSIVREFNLLPALARILINRGIVTSEQVRAYLYPQAENMHSPWLMCGMKEAVQKISIALSLDQKIAIHGDYDADGITATVILVEALRNLGGKVDFYLPSRFDEGYGLHCEPLRRFKEENIALVITVDCGINAIQELKYAREIGLDIIVTDHHQPLVELPESVIAINPMQNNCPYPFKELSGSGIAFKLAAALYEQLEKPRPEALLDLAALGTVADVVSLLGENRVIVSNGLKILNKHERTGLKALIQATGQAEKTIDSTALAFILAPSINAAGRMGEALPAAQLLLANEMDEAMLLAGQLHEINQKRRSTEQEILKTAQSAAAELVQQSDPPVVTLAADNWHHGVIGIVASRLLERFNRPIVLIALEGNEGKGSARSIPGFDITEALAANKEVLLKYGGHEQAAGFTVERKQVDTLREGLNNYAVHNSDRFALKPRVEIETELDADEIVINLAESIKLLQPFGQDNPLPLFGSKNWEIRSWRLVGKDQKHLKLNIKKNETILEPIFFSAAEYDSKLESGRKIDLAFRIKEGFFNGGKTLDLVVEGIEYSDVYKTGNLELHDRRYRLDRLEYLQQILKANPELRKRTAIFCALRSGIETIKASLDSNPQPLFITGGDLYQGRQLIIEPELVIFYDLPLKVETFKPFLVRLKKGFPLKVYLLFNTEAFEVNRVLLNKTQPALDQVELLLSSLRSETEPQKNPIEILKNKNILDLKPLPIFWETMDLVFREIGLTKEGTVRQQTDGSALKISELLKLSPTLAAVKMARDESETIKEKIGSLQLEDVAMTLIRIMEERQLL